MSDLELNQLVMQKKYDEIVLVAILGGTHERLNKKSNKDLLVKQLTLIAKYADSDMVGAYAVIMLHCLGAMSRIEAMEILVSLNVEDIDYNVLDYDCDRLLMVMLKEADSEDYDFDSGLDFAQVTVEKIIDSETNSKYIHLGV